MRGRINKIAWLSWLGCLILALAVLTITSCTSPHQPVHGTGIENDLGWPKAHQTWHQTLQLQPGWEQGKQLWEPTAYDALQAAIPVIEGAEVAGFDEFCATCHETYVKAFADNVHRELSCEQCHGEASLHLAGRGLRADSILSLRKPEIGTTAGRLLSPAERSEICLQCHEDDGSGGATPCLPGLQWRTSSHANKEVACTDCHRAHYLVPPGTPSADEITTTAHPDDGQSGLAGVQPYGADSWPVGRAYRPARANGQLSRLPPVQTASFISADDPSPPGVESRRAESRKLGAISPSICYDCHGDMRRLEEIPHAHQLGVTHVVNNQPIQLNCTTCHDAHGNVRAETRKDLCLQCHQDVHSQEWSGSPHDIAGVGCTDCHDPHPQSGPPMQVDEPGACYKCHPQMKQLEEVAHPHQILGSNGFLCTTCHRPHAAVDSTTREDTCLKCHSGAPTMAWHSSVHRREGVACADCHNAHPQTRVPQYVSVSHTAVQRRRRLPMSVDEPGVCYKCHTEIFGKVSMPSHHPIREGKMVCSDCHDSHGEARGNLKADSLNDLCYECHAEKEGPFVWEHPPATENCAHCHDPHGTVTNNLLHQPTTFLCLRCHVGHSTHEFDGANTCLRCHTFSPLSTDIGDGPLPDARPTTPASRRALFTDCTQCHTQIHGNDLTRGFECGGGMRR